MGSSRLDWVPPESFDEYRLVKVLGRGSLGQVWLAHDTVLDRLVAVKFIAEVPAHDTVRQRFLTEGRAAARVQHPNIVAVYRVGEIGPRPYLVSEYVRGTCLDEIARPVAWPRLREIAMGLARGLAAAHRQGVLHGDLKPARAMLSDSGDVKLHNFGRARLLPQVAPGHAEVPSTHDGAATMPGDPTLAPQASSERVVRPLPEGTPPGLVRTWAPSAGGPRVNDAPGLEPAINAGSEPATPRADVYSLGALLYELAAGTRLHGRGSLPWAGGLAEDPPPLAVAAPGIDPGFAAIVDRCVRRDPGERFASGDAVRAALEALAAGGEPAARAAPSRPSHPPSLRPRRAILLAAALLLALALVAYAATSQRGAAAPWGCPGGMLAVPAGTFRMGSPADGAGEPDEQPQHDVTLSAYCIDRTEVTVAAYAVCVAAGGCRPAALTVNWTNFSPEEVKHFSQRCNGQDRPDHPINCVDWDQAAAYCRWSGKHLPTEAEWEHAARGHDGRVYPWGNEAPSVTRMNACGSECGEAMKREKIMLPSLHDGNDGWETTAPVGRYPAGASPFGALDLAGNVAEWTADWYRFYESRAELDPRGPPTGASRVVRGGGWMTSEASKLSATDRDWPDPTLRGADLGFRCARSN
jgi:formylglycine-generating enzyme required for sulfatase activity